MESLTQHDFNGNINEEYFSSITDKDATSFKCISPNNR